MPRTRGYATEGPSDPLKPFEFDRRDPGPNDVVIEILFCGICHSDIHQARNEWENATYPMVPGHEIVGRVTKTGAAVTRFAAGDIAGVGCFVDSCRRCASCNDGEEQYCENHLALTYNGTEMDEVTPTFGGYSSQIVVDEKYALKVRADQPLANVAPLLCAGITTYSPLKRWGAGPGKRVGVVGLGGLGHMGVKIASAMGAEVTVFSTSPSKEADARELGAHHFVVTRDPAALEPLVKRYDMILDCVSANHDINLYLNMVKRDGTLVLVGAPETPLAVGAFPLIMSRRQLAGSLIGGIRETQEMLDFCAEHGFAADVEKIGIDRVNEAYDRTIKGDVRYRFVIDMATL